METDQRSHDITPQKRRTIGLGPGGLSRERAGFEGARRPRRTTDVSARLKTPEGEHWNDSVGVVRRSTTSFIESPYRKIKGSAAVIDESAVVTCVTGDHKSAIMEQKHELRRSTGADGKAQAPAQVDPFEFYLYAWEEDRQHHRSGQRWS